MIHYPLVVAKTCYLYRSSVIQTIDPTPPFPPLEVKEEKHLEIHGGLREDIGMKTYLHGPMDYAKNLKVRSRVGDLDLPERRKRYTSSPEDEDVATNMCPCGTTTDNRTHIVG